MGELDGDENADGYDSKIFDSKSHLAKQMLSLFDMLLSIGKILQFISDVDNLLHRLYFNWNHVGSDYNYRSLKYPFGIQINRGRPIKSYGGIIPEKLPDFVFFTGCSPHPGFAGLQ